MPARHDGCRPSAPDRCADAPIFTEPRSLCRARSPTGRLSRTIACFAALVTAGTDNCCTCSRAVQPCSRRPLTGPADAGRPPVNRLAPQLLMTPSGRAGERRARRRVGCRAVRHRRAVGRRQAGPVPVEGYRGPTTAGGRTLGLRRMATLRPAGSSPRQPSRRRRRPAGRSRR